MSITKFQCFSPYDKLVDFKVNSVNKYYNCSFFEHKVNATTSLNFGKHNDKTVSERIITDGNISLENISKDPAMVIWENHILPLEDGKSIDITIDRATFMVVSITYGNNVHHEIHVEHEDEGLLRHILHLIYKENGNSEKTSSITFKNPAIILLETIVNKNKTRETLNLKNGKTR
jgi:hypothetical protein